MATSWIAVTTGSGLNVATHSFTTEDAVTKQIQRIVVSNAAGTDLATSSNPIAIAGSVTSSIVGTVTTTGNVYIVNAITGNVAASVTGSVAIANAITGNVAIANALTGNVTLVGTSAVTGSVILIGTSAITGNVTISGVSGVTGNVSIVGAITGNVAASVTGSVAIANAITGNVAICNAITGNVAASVTGSVAIVNAITGNVAASVTGSVAIANSITGNVTNTFYSYPSFISKITYTTGASGNVATPSTGKRINLTDVLISATSAGTVYLYDNVDTATSCVTATLSLAIQGGAVLDYKKPYVSSATGNILKWVASTGAGGSVFVHYYETV